MTSCQVYRQDLNTSLYFEVFLEILIWRKRNKTFSFIRIIFIVTYCNIFWQSVTGIRLDNLELQKLILVVFFFVIKSLKSYSHDILAQNSVFSYITDFQYCGHYLQVDSLKISDPTVQQNSLEFFSFLMWHCNLMVFCILCVRRGGYRLQADYLYEYFPA